MVTDNLREWLSFCKFFLGTFVLGLLTFVVNRDIQNREIEIKEQEHIAKYIEHAIQDDVGMRLRFAQYFTHVTRFETLKERWSDYLKVVQAEYDKDEQEKNRLITESQGEKVTAIEKDYLLAKVSELEAALKPKPKSSKTRLPLASIIYMHVSNLQQKERADKISLILSEEGFLVPATQVLNSVPDVSTFRYFRKREKDYAISALNLIKNSAPIELKYMPGYESSTKLRDRHFEIWFSKDAFQ
jgi:hypothetical protein